MIEAKEKTEGYDEFCKEILNDKRGRLAPYIGKKYDEGLPIQGNKGKKLLVIGPRHACDGIYNSRNILAYLTGDIRKKLQSGQSFPESLKVGCVKTDPKDCLKEDSCPVFLNPQNKKCPQEKKCGIKKIQKVTDDFYCKGERKLRCENILAVNDYINDPVIESGRRGQLYFQRITDYLSSLINSKSKVGKGELWNHVSFINMIQKFIPFNGIYDNSNKINGRIDNEDREYAQQIVDKLNPDVILMTMKCVRDSLHDLLIGCGYEEAIYNRNLDYYLYARKKNDVIPEWHNEIIKYFNNYNYPKRVREFGLDLKVLINGLKKSHHGELSKKSWRRHVHEFLCDIFSEEAVEEKRYDFLEKFPSTYRKRFCFQKETENRAESMRDWLKNLSKNS